MFKGREKIFYIDREIDLNTRKDICEVLDWLDCIKKIDKCKEESESILV